MRNEAMGFSAAAQIHNSSSDNVVSSSFYPQTPTCMYWQEDASNDHIFSFFTCCDKSSDYLLDKTFSSQKKWVDCICR